MPATERTSTSGPPGGAQGGAQADGAHGGAHTGAHGSAQAGGERRWTFLTNHGHLLLAVARSPDARVHELAAVVGITERAALLILRDLEDATTCTAPGSAGAPATRCTAPGRCGTRPMPDTASTSCSPSSPTTPGARRRQRPTATLSVESLSDSTRRDADRDPRR